MKAEELMIDDWVFCTYWPEKKVERVFEIKRVADDNLKVVIFDEVNLVFQDKYIEPIPLTSEILERNDFIKTPFPSIEGQHVWTLHLFPSRLVSLVTREINDNTDNGWMIVITMPPTELQLKIDYVHELQHALRLCGIDKEIKL